MHEPTLILNRSWTAIGVTPSRRALVLLVRDSAAAVCPESYELFDLGRWIERTEDRRSGLRRERVVRTPSAWVEKPEVLLLRRYGGLPRREVPFSRRNLLLRDQHQCQYCLRRRPTSDLSIDHVVPRSRGGQTHWENCVLACLRCNTKKADRTPAESGLRLHRQPRRPAWSPLLGAPASRPESWSKFLRSA